MYFLPRRVGLGWEKWFFFLARKGEIRVEN
jgi:hypothetical protein